MGGIEARASGGAAAGGRIADRGRKDVAGVVVVFDWNDLKYLLALARTGSLAGAARALGVDASTAQRRLSELERRLGRPLIRRDRAGYRLTAFGRSLQAEAERVEAAVLGLERLVTVGADGAAGVIRLTCPEPLVARLTDSGLFAAFERQHPGLRVEFVLSDRYLDLKRGDADVALRSGDTDDGDLVGRKLADSLWAVYASPDYLERCGMPTSSEDFAAHAWVGFDDAMGQHRAAAWLRQVAPHARVVARSSSVLGLASSARAGVGLAALPTALGDGDAALVRVTGPVPELTRLWRILTTRELRQTPRVAALFDFVVEHLDALQPVLRG